MLERPLWAIEAGCRAVALSARFRPTPAEILDAIDEASKALRYALAEAKVARQTRRTESPPEPPDADAKARIAALVAEHGKRREGE